MPGTTPHSGNRSEALRGRTIAILENRAGEQLADVLRRHGATPLRAPALAELPDVDEHHLAELLAQWRDRPPHAFVFQTGVGVRALLEATDRIGATDALLALLRAAVVIVRGPKPTGVLRGRGVRIDVAAADPYTTHQVLQAIDAAGVTLSARDVVVQRYGESNLELARALEHRGARVTEVGTYRWSLPQDCAPLHALLDELEHDRVDAVAFTSGVQATNLFRVATEAARGDALGASLQRTLIASIGPVCSATLRDLGVRVDVEAHPPKLGPLVAALCEAFGARG